MKLSSFASSINSIILRVNRSEPIPFGKLTMIGIFILRDVDTDAGLLSNFNA